MGINLGALLGPLVAGYLAQRVDWHIGFACAGVGMTLGLIQYILGRRHLQPGIDRLEQARKAARTPASSATAASAPSGRLVMGFTGVEWKRLAAMGVFFVFAAIFWGAYEQAGSTLQLFGDRYSRTVILGFDFPSSWFQTVQAIFVIVLAPVFAWLWIRLGKARAVHAGEVRDRSLLRRTVVHLPAAGRVQPSGLAEPSRKPLLASRVLLHPGAR